MSIAADNFAVSNTDASATEVEAQPTPRRFAAGKFAVAFVATILVGSGLRTIADAGVSQAIDNYYAKQAAVFSTPVPDLAAATNASDEASTDTSAAAQ